LHPLVKKLAQQTAIYGVSSILARFLNYALVPIQTRVFHPGEYGVVTQFYAYTGFLYILFTYGMETAFFRYANLKGDKKQVYDTGMASLLFTSLLLSLVLIVFRVPIANAMQFYGHTEYVTLLALIMALDSIVTIPFAYLRQENRPIRFATFKVFNIGVNVVLNIFFLVVCPWILNNPSLTALHGFVQEIYHHDVVYIFIANLAASVATVLVMWRYFFIRQWNISVGLWKEMVRYAWPLIIVGLAGMGNELLSRILLTRRWDGTFDEAIHALGVFGACYKMSLLMTLFVQAYRMAAEPFFFGESKKLNPQITYARTMNFFVIFCCFIFLLVTLNIDFFKEIFMGKEYFDGVRVVPVLLLANFFLGVYYNLTIWYKLTNKNFAGSLIAFGGVIITFTLNWIWIPHYGYYGSSWVTFICYSSMMIVSYFLGQRYYPVPYDIRRFFFYVLIAVGIFFLQAKITSSLAPDMEYLKYLFAAIFMSMFLGIVYVIETGKVRFMKVI
jgi:O-antigen/teichoic acid export membrane protein